MAIRIILNESEDRSLFTVDKNDFITFDTVLDNVQDEPEMLDYYTKIQKILGIADPKNIAVVHDDNMLDSSDLSKFKEVKTIRSDLGDLTIISSKGVKAVMTYNEGGFTSVFINKKYVSLA